MIVALCKKIWTLESGKVLLVEFENLGFGIRITIEIRNPSSTDKESKIQYLESRIQNPRSSLRLLPAWIPLDGVNLNTEIVFSFRK